MLYKIFLFFGILLAGMQLRAQLTLEERVDSIIGDKKARVGVAVSVDGKICLAMNDRAGYAMMSTFKFPLALAVLHHLDQRGLPLSTELSITKSDLLPNTYSPLRDARPNGGFRMSVGELLRYCVALSDNNASDILIRYIGGIEKVHQYVKRLGIRGMKIVATEADMHRTVEYQNLNQTRPSAAVRLMEKFLKEDLFAHEYHEFLEKTLIETSTGTNKLKGGLPDGVVMGHKTGSSDRNSSGLKIGDNDMGFVCLPNGKYYTIAVFVTDSMEDDVTNAAIIAKISEVVYRHLALVFSID